MSEKLKEDKSEDKPIEFVRSGSNVLKIQREARGLEAMNVLKKTPLEERETLCGNILQLHNSETITKFEINEMADLFREIFANTGEDGWGQFLHCEDCEEEVSAKEFFGLDIDEPDVPIAKLDAIEDLGTCDCCDGKLHRVFDKEITRKAFHEKFSNDSRIVLIKDKLGQLKGMSFIYKTSLRDAFEMEEWEYPYLYSKYKGERRSFLDFQRLITEAIENDTTKDFSRLKFTKKGLIAETNQSWNYNCIAVDRSLRGDAILPEMVYAMFKTIPNDDALSCMGLAEVVSHSKGEMWAMYSQPLMIDGFFEEGKKLISYYLPNVFLAIDSGIKSIYGIEETAFKDKLPTLK